jgi:hypothetical protein
VSVSPRKAPRREKIIFWNFTACLNASACTNRQENPMKLFTRLTAAFGLTALLAVSAFAQTPMTPMPGAHVKGYTKTLKSGKTVAVKGYTRKAKPMPKTMVKSYTKTLKSGKTVTVKGYTRKAPMKSMMKKPTM